MSTVLCTGTAVVDLSDGRSLAPGEVATDIDVTTPHNRALVVGGALHVTEGPTVRVPPTPQALVNEALNSSKETTA